MEEELILPQQDLRGIQTHPVFIEQFNGFAPIGLLHQQQLIIIFMDLDDVRFSLQLLQDDDQLVLEVIDLFVKFTHIGERDWDSGHGWVYMYVRDIAQGRLNERSNFRAIS